jgi:hypothetical protein
MKLEVLYFEGCPNHMSALKRIWEILREESCDAEVEEVLVPDADAAQSAKFLGSPQRNRHRTECRGTRRLRSHVPQVPRRNPLP